MLQSGRVAFGAMETVVFGKPAAETVAEEARRRDAERVFLMVSGTLNRTTDEIAKVRRALGNRFAGLFDHMPPHTPRHAVIEAAEMAREAGADLIVTVGGGSITDGAKAVQLCLANNVRNAEAIGGLRPVKGPDGALGPPPDMKPPSVRQVTVHTPEWLFLSTGIRAVDHCVEGICSGEANPYGDAQALHGLSLLAHGLPRVKADPGDLAARLDCQTGSWLSMAPLASGVPMGASHGIGYVLGTMFDIPHGHTSCIMLPAVMRWNKPANTEHQALVAAAMGHPGEDAGDVLDAFIAGLGMPRSLGAVNIEVEHFDRIAEQAMGTPWVPRNPRPIAGPAQVREILELAA